VQEPGLPAPGTQKTPTENTGYLPMVFGSTQAALGHAVNGSRAKGTRMDRRWSGWISCSGRGWKCRP